MPFRVPACVSGWQAHYTHGANRQATQFERALPTPLGSPTLPESYPPRSKGGLPTLSAAGRQGERGNRTPVRWAVPTGLYGRSLTREGKAECPATPGVAALPALQDGPAKPRHRHPSAFPPLTDQPLTYPFHRPDDAPGTPDVFCLCRTARLASVPRGTLQASASHARTALPLPSAMLSFPP